MSNPNVHPGWTRLLSWLADNGASVSTESIYVEPREIQGAGYGLIARQDIQSSTKLLRIPAKVLLNKSTLAPLYPRTARKLSAIQLISLHLYLNCPLNTKDFSEEVPFGPYISILPRDFSFHPVFWLCVQEIADEYNELLKNLSPGVATKLTQRADSLISDWAVVRDYLQANHSALVDKNLLQCPTTNTTSVDKNFVWAWLVVNTRCIYYRLNYLQSHEDNLTLAPIVDFANHQVSDTTIKVDFSKQMGGDLIVSLPKDYTMRGGDEVYLTYGRHPNSTLFAEYGFVDRELNEGKEVDLTVTVTGLFDKRGKLGLELKKILETHNYWGDWTVHSSSAFAYPSYRLITALRLYHIVDPLTAGVPSDFDTRVEVWEDTIFGRKATISADNEAGWKAALHRICQEVVADVKSRVVCLVEAERQFSRTGMKGSIFDLRFLCEEEIAVCLGVCKSIEDNVEF